MGRLKREHRREMQIRKRQHRRKMQARARKAQLFRHHARPPPPPPPPQRPPPPPPLDPKVRTLLKRFGGKVLVTAQKQGIRFPSIPREKISKIFINAATGILKEKKGNLDAINFLEFFAVSVAKLHALAIPPPPPKPKNWSKLLAARAAQSHLHPHRRRIPHRKRIKVLA